MKQFNKIKIPFALAGMLLAGSFTGCQNEESENNAHKIALNL